MIVGSLTYFASYALFDIKDIFPKLCYRDLLPSSTSKVRLMEGAHNNIPDAAAFEAAMEICKMTTKLGDSHLLLTLISGTVDIFVI